MNTQRPSPCSFRDGQQLESLDEFDATFHDPYQLRERLSEPSVCTDCHAVYDDGCWQWMTSPAGAFQIRCPACKRVRDGAPAGFVTIEGRFAKEYRNELQLLIQNIEQRARSTQPMQRIISVEEQPDGLTVATTDIHLARKIGEALHDTYKGNLDFHYNETNYLLRVRWQRWN